MSPVIILGIESSCDETGVAIYHETAGVLAHQLHSQIERHRAYGGTVPELAARDHIAKLLPLVEAALEEAQIPQDALTAIAYTAGPGLIGALLVGATFAHGFAAGLGKPVVPVHHMEAHALSALLHLPLEEQPTRYLLVLVSGGHSELVLVDSDHGGEDPAQAAPSYRIVGQTVDDAAGEAFDKAARCLGLGYPGGPAIAACARQGDATRFALPRPMLHSHDGHMSFSGLKTALWQTWAKTEQSEQDRHDLAASFEAAVVDVLTVKIMEAAEQLEVNHAVLAGGVAANQALRQRLLEEGEKRGVQLLYPPLSLCTDNGVMAAYAGFRRYQLGHYQAAGAVEVKTRWPLSAWCTD